MMKNCSSRYGCHAGTCASEVLFTQPATKAVVVAAFTKNRNYEFWENGKGSGGSRELFYLYFCMRHSSVALDCEDSKEEGLKDIGEGVDVSIDRGEVDQKLFWDGCSYQSVLSISFRCINSYSCNCHLTPPSSVKGIEVAKCPSKSIWKKTKKSSFCIISYEAYANCDTQRRGETAFPWYHGSSHSSQRQVVPSSCTWRLRDIGASMELWEIMELAAAPTVKCCLSPGRQGLGNASGES